MKRVGNASKATVSLLEVGDLCKSTAPWDSPVALTG